MSAFAGAIRTQGLPRSVAVVIAACALAFAAAAAIAYGQTQPSTLRGIIILSFAGAGLVAARRLPWTVLPLALVVMALGMGNLELHRMVHIPIAALQTREAIVLATFVALAGVGAALDASAPRRPAWPANLTLAGVFVALTVGSLWYANDPSLSRWAVVHQLTQMMALFAGFFWIRHIGEARGLVAILALATAVSAALALWQFSQPIAFEETIAPYVSTPALAALRYWVDDVGRVGSVWIYAPPLAAFLSALLPALLYVTLRRPGPTTIAAGIAFAATVIALALTGTRLALLGGAVGTGVFLVARGGSLRFSRAGGLVAATLVIGTIFASALAASRVEEGGVLGRLGSLFGDDRQVSVSITGRQAIYDTLVENWRSSPLLGVGLGNSRPDIEDVTTYNSTPHSYWLGLLAETGVAGVGIMALLMASMVRHYRRLLRRRGSAESTFAAVALAASSALLVQSFFDNAMLVWQIGVMFWLLQGAVISLSLRADGHEPPGREAPHGR